MGLGQKVRIFEDKKNVFTGIKTKKNPNKKLTPALNQQRSCIEAADWSIVPQFKFFEGFLN